MPLYEFLRLPSTPDHRYRKKGPGWRRLGTYMAFQLHRKVSLGNIARQTQDKYAHQCPTPILQRPVLIQVMRWCAGFTMRLSSTFVPNWQLEFSKTLNNWRRTIAFYLTGGSSATRAVTNLRTRTCLPVRMISQI
ncbi:Mannitol 2-dehydrogenase [Fusarium oxysporum f. sp. albedinis]|nr:Mannitol 2-dehydrogenase [Fusarium oxysporum f. sp. albedinis]